MEKYSVKKNNNLLEKARALRRNMTKQENHLWYDFLQHYPVKIYKQRIIDNYIADFYCHKARLVIEIDGAHHFSDEGKEYDKARTEALEKYDLVVVRFSNSDVDNRFDLVCERIDRIIMRRLEECN